MVGHVDDDYDGRIRQEVRNMCTYVCICTYVCVCLWKNSRLVGENRLKGTQWSVNFQTLSGHNNNYQQICKCVYVCVYVYSTKVCQVEYVRALAVCWYMYMYVYAYVCVFYLTFCNQSQRRRRSCIRRNSNRKSCQLLHMYVCIYVCMYVCSRVCVFEYLTLKWLEKSYSSFCNTSQLDALF